MERRQIILGRKGNYWQGDGEINALFSEIKGAHTPPWGPQIRVLVELIFVDNLTAQPWLHMDFAVNKTLRPQNGTLKTRGKISV